MSNMSALLTAFTGARVRQIKRDALTIAFIVLMSVLASFMLLGAVAAYVAQTHGPVIGLLSAAAVPVGLAVIALVVRAWLRHRAKRRRRLATTSVASALAVSTASNVIAQNKGMAIAAGLVVGLVAGSLLRSGRD